MSAGRVHLADYRPFTHAIPTIDLDIALDPEATIVRSRLAIRRQPGTAPDAPLVLDGRDLVLLAARLDGEALAPDAFAATADRFTLFNPPETGVLELDVQIHPAANQAKKGLFWHQGVLASHCEPEGFRRITYFADRPDVLARYTVRLEADKARFPILLSNGERVAEGAGADRHWARWVDPHPKPSYIFAVMAGAFDVLSDHFVTGDGRLVALAIHAEAGEAPRCSFALDALKAAMDWDETVFGLRYDLDTYNVVALPAYSGAQENKGLNLFGADGVIADPAITTDEDYLLIKRIIGHEYFHNWTGNRVTCRDWFQLSLKEGLTRLRDQLFMEDVQEPGVFRIEQVKALRRNQFPEDDGPAAHPVQPDSFQEIENFYTNTIYEKGAEVLRMARTLVGEAAFIASIRAYLARFDGQAVTITDLLAVIAETNAIDLEQFTLWLKTAGRPRVEARGAYDPATRVYTLELSQSLPRDPASAAPLHIPVSVALLARDGRPLRGATLLPLRAARETFRFEGIDEPPVPSILRGFTAPVSLVNPLSDAELATLALHDDDPFVSWNSAQDLMIRAVRAMAGEIRAGREAVAPPILLDVVEALVARAPSAPSLSAQALRLPDEPVLSEGLPQIDLDGHMAALAVLRGAIARRLGDRLPALHRALDGLDSNDRSAITLGRRALRGVCLELMLGGDRDAALAALRAQIDKGPSITEAFDALCLMGHVDTPDRAAVFEAFYRRHQDQPLIIDKWFKAYALARAPGVIDEIIALEGHPAFDLRNTARVVAYYGSLFRQNRVTFHDPSGKAYRFLADRLLLMDKMGGGRPAYFTPQLEQWRRHREPRQGLMRAELERLAATPGITGNLREVAERALG